MSWLQNWTRGSCTAWMGLIAALPLAADQTEFFETRVRPVFAKNCYACHASTKMGGLRVDSREALLKGGNSGPAIVPNKPEDSLLIQALTHTHSRLRMPPPGKLSEETIGNLVEWIRQGAVWPAPPHTASKPGSKITPEQRSFWSFQPLRKPPIPNVRLNNWAKSPIDRFILAKLEAKGLVPVKPAEKRVLIRRAHFDLIGLPPTPEDVDAFINDTSSDAFASLVDRLLASPDYGERWGRYWLDIARYGDERLASTKDDPLPNAFRYRDWIVRAFNDDMPYDMFIKAQIGADLLENVDRERYLPGLGFYGLSPEFQDDRVDVTTRGFLALTVACAQCHDHKYDPIPQKDYYSLLGVFTSTKPHEIPLAPAADVERYQKQKKQLDALEKEFKDFLKRETLQIGEILAGQISRYLIAARKVFMGAKTDQAARDDNLDIETLERWIAYLRSPKEHPYLREWDALIARGASDAEARKLADEFQNLALSVIREKKEFDGQKGADAKKAATLEPAKMILWKDLYFSNPRPDLPYVPPLGILYHGEVNQYPDMELQVLRFLDGDRRKHVDGMMAEIERAKASLPPKYPYLNAIADVEKPTNERIRIGGNADQMGDEAPRRFLSVLSEGEPQPFRKGSGRLELAEAIASPTNPLTARVMVNRIWMYHFGEGLVRTPGNFGQSGEKPSHPELLDYLAMRFVESGWSSKAMHREIMLSAAYQLSSDGSENNSQIDSQNYLLWRANRRRLDAEALRDSLLFVAGRLEPQIGGPAVWLTENYATKRGPDGEADKYSQAAEWVTGLRSRRTIYGHISRRRPDDTLALFDFPNPAATSERRFATSTPLQRLFFLNSDFVVRQAEGVTSRLKPESDVSAKIRQVYQILFGRYPDAAELQLGLEFVRGKPDAWPEYAQALMSSNEFLYVK